MQSRKGAKAQSKKSTTLHRQQPAPQLKQAERKQQCPSTPSSLSSALVQPWSQRSGSAASWSSQVQFEQGVDGTRGSDLSTVGMTIDAYP